MRDKKLSARPRLFLEQAKVLGRHEHLSCRAVARDRLLRNPPTQGAAHAVPRAGPFLLGWNIVPPDVPQRPRAR
jgi:hypothetical protein